MCKVVYWSRITPWLPSQNYRSWYSTHNDLVNWTKYPQNPLLTNARWPSMMSNADRKHRDLLYLAFRRDYDTPTSYVVLGTTTDGVHIKEVKTLIQPVPNQRNQNPNLFRDPRSGPFLSDLVSRQRS